MLIVFVISVFPEALQRYRIGTIRINAVFLYRIRDSLVVQHTIVRQRLER